ncbi:diguanylate cyclase [Rhizobium sp. Root73]|uniref:putative bifunctional diguanylate cyclase/phosphodiesterase n=1 Tax=unclassified Rhizobium TaxID=2613769 RepID=UPI0007138E80|nr:MULTISPECIES: bifunctional diguanylate cyclase/phosphodiesterase [unclassified Rhizobium]KQV29796.1 diguanylate cyclase [Rhizobium sp. Root1204]KQY05073.1 diguanylate cyclase [Rhizobium sp. Root1334]KRC01703.1 diguanylate cyclase [Rhizobium sp. Root73]
MLKVLSCIATDHSYGLLALAALVCVLGSILTVRLYVRVQRSAGMQKLNWLFMSGVVGGSTIWMTHFIAMLSFNPPLAHAYEPMLTMASLAAAIVITIMGFLITAAGRPSIVIEFGGCVVGAGIAIMHYTGMAGYQIAGRLEWDQSHYAASVFLGIGFGAVAMSLIARPGAPARQYAGILALVLAITTMHFTGMSAITIIPDSLIVTSNDMIPESLLTVVVAIIGLMLALGASTYAIDLQSTRGAAERFRHLSLHDPLTGLPNRVALGEKLQEIIDRHKDGTAGIAVLSFDLDRFKDVNDVHGHAAGDAVLQGVAGRMSKVLGKGEFIARMGGDEFVALSSNLARYDDATAFASRLVEAIIQPVEWEGKKLQVGTSVGISHYPADARTPQALLAQADLAMYRAKAVGSNAVRRYEPAMDDAARDRSALAMDMRQGIERNEFELYYQYQNNSLTRDVIGFEVLLRWHHPVRGMVPPAEFIPIADRNGFIHELGDWVLRTACQQAACWTNPLKIAVNVAPGQLTNVNLAARVQEILLETGLEPCRLELEITESGIIADQQNALRIIRQLKQLGVKIAMDDYGTGYSSLTTLQNFPFDKIKIDRAFIDGVTTSRQSAAIVRSTIILADSLGIPVLAEGVECEEHMDFLLNEGCPQVQGYLFGRPMPLSEISHVVNRPPCGELPGHQAGGIEPETLPMRSAVG